MGNLAGSLGTFLVGVVILAGIFVMVRPNSKGPALVNSVATALVNLVNAGTGGGKWGS